MFDVFMSDFLHRNTEFFGISKLLSFYMLITDSFRLGLVNKKTDARLEGHNSQVHPALFWNGRVAAGTGSVSLFRGAAEKMPGAVRQGQPGFCPR